MPTVAPTAADLTRLIAAVALREGASVELRSTDCSIVLLSGDRAYKLKRPVRYDFVDQSTPALRLAACLRETRLGASLAPSVMLGVDAVVETGEAGYELVPGVTPGAVDHVIEMRRFDENHTLRSLIERDAAGSGHARAVGERLAHFHAAAVRDTRDPGQQRRYAANLDTLEHQLADSRLPALRRFGDAFLTGHASVLRARARGGLIVDGHGDVRAEHVLFENGLVEIVDRLDIDDLRTLDVADELAFLLMDLEALGARALGADVLAGYRASGGAAPPSSLLAFYGAYRAEVRATVATLQGDEASAEQLLGLAQRLAWRARGPVTLLVTGPPGSGKTTLAEALSAASGLPVLSSDAVRREAPTGGAYDLAARARVYELLGRRAAEAGAAIVDATFGHPTLHAAFATAGARDVVVVDCCAPRALRLDRAATRRVGGFGASDAGADEAAMLGDAHQAPTALSSEPAITVRTTAPLAQQVDAVEAALDRRLAAGDHR